MTAILDLKDFLEAYSVDQTQSLDPKHQGSVYPAVEKATQKKWPKVERVASAF